jgi:hypothetical protein
VNGRGPQLSQGIEAQPAAGALLQQILLHAQVCARRHTDARAYTHARTRVHARTRPALEAQLSPPFPLAPRERHQPPASHFTHFIPAEDKHTTSLLPLHAASHLADTARDDDATTRLPACSE